MNEYNAPNTSEPVSVKKTGSKTVKWLIIGGIAAVVMVISVLVVTVAAAAVMNAPMNLVTRGIANSAEALEDHPVGSLLGEAMESGSMELMLQLDPLFDVMFGHYGIDLSGAMDLKIYGDGENERAAAVAQLELDGQEMLDVSVLATGQEMVVMSDSLLGDEVYGILYETAADKFETSVFGPGGYLDLGIDSLEDAVENTKLSREMREDAETIAEELTEVLMKSLKEHAEVSKANEELTFSGESTRVTAVEIALDSEGYAAVMRDVIAYLKESESVRNYVEQYAVVSGEQDFADEFYRQLAEAEAELENFDEFERLVFVFYITKLGKELVGADLKVYYDAESGMSTERMELRAGPTLRDIREFELRVTTAGYEERIRYKVVSDDEKEYRAELTYESYGVEMYSLELDWNKESGALSVMLSEDYSYMEVKGTLHSDREQAELIVTSINVDGEVLNLDLRVTVKARDEFPEHLIDPEYTEFLDLTNSDLEMLAGRVSSRLMNKVALLNEELQWILALLLMG